jgi:hypothetical protein
MRGLDTAKERPTRPPPKNGLLDHTTRERMKEMNINEPFLESLGIILLFGRFQQIQIQKQAKSRKEMFFRTCLLPSSKFIYFIEPI